VSQSDNEIGPVDGLTPSADTDRISVVVTAARHFEGYAGQSLAEVLHRGSMPLSTSCGGRGRCGTCRVRVVAGGESLAPPDPHESRLLGRGRLAAGERLACRVRVPAGCIEIAPVLDVRAVDKSAPGALTPGKAAVEFRQVKVRPPSLADARSDWTRLEASLDLPRALVPGSPFLVAHVASLIGTLSETESAPCRAAITDDGKLLGILGPGQRALGAALDLGTTTVAAYLLDLEGGSLFGVGSAINRQCRYGDDIMSRAAAGPRAAEDLRSLVWASALEALAAAGLDDARDLLDVVVVGNSVMHHLALGLPVERLVRAPYVPAAVEPLVWIGESVHPALAPWTRVRFPSLVAGFVGSDALVGIMAAADGRATPTFYIDIGTNAEMALLHRGETWACSAAAGSALEGSRLTCGSAAGPGAVVQAWVEGGEVSVRTWDGGAPLSIAGTGALSLIAALRREGALDDRGLLVPQRLAPTVLTEVDGGRAVALASGVVLTEADVGEVLLARAAFAAGRELLLREAGVEEGELRCTVVAGTLGNEAAPDDLQALGLVPAGVPVEAVGNAAGQGACQVLLDRDVWDRCRERSVLIHHVELSASKEFPDTFVEHLRFP